MPMEDLFRLVRTVTVAQILERDDFSKRWAAQRADLHARAAVPGAAGLRLRRGARRRRARRHRPDLQPADGPRDPVRLRPAAAVDPHRAAAGRHRRRAEDVQVAGQPRSASPSRPADMYGKTLQRPRRGAGRVVRRCCSGAPRAGGRAARATPSARSRARSWTRFHGADAAREAEAALRPRVRRARAARGRSRRPSCRRPTASVHLPGADRRRCSAARARRPGASWPRAASSSTASRWRPDRSTSRRPTLDGARAAARQAPLPAPPRRPEDRCYSPAPLRRRRGSPRLGHAGPDALDSAARSGAETAAREPHRRNPLRQQRRGGL